MQELDMCIPFGGKANYEELKWLLGKNEEIDREDPNKLPLQWSWRSKGGQRHSLSPGRVHPEAGDFFFYNHWKGVRVTALKARQGLSAPPEDAATVAVPYSV